MSDKRLYKFHWDCGRMGALTGVFVATPAEVQAAIGLEVDFGEALGKHSEIFGPLDAEDVTEITGSPEAIRVFEEHLAGSVGWNPLRHLQDDADRGGKDGGA